MILLSQKKEEEYLQYFKSVFLNKLKDVKILNDIINRFEKGPSHEYLYGLNNSLKSVCLAYFAERLNKPLIYVASSVSNALRIQIETSLLVDVPVKYFPAIESSPYEMVYSNVETIREQLSCLELLFNNTPSVIILNPKVLVEGFLSQEQYICSSLCINLKDELDPQELTKKLVDLGYKRVSIVVDPGEFSIRGDICDVYPVSSSPVRIEVAFDNVDSIREINVDTQRSVKAIKNVIIRPRYKTVLNSDKRQSLIEDLYLALSNSKKSLEKEEYLNLEENVTNIIIQLEECNYFEGIEYFAPFINKNSSTVLDMLNEENIIILDELVEIENIVQNHINKLNSEYENGVNSGNLVELPYRPVEKLVEIQEKLQNFSKIQLNLLPENQQDMVIYSELVTEFIPGFMSNLKTASRFVKKLQKENYTVLVTTEYPQRVQSVFSEWDCHAEYLSEESKARISDKDVVISKLGFTDAFVCSDLKIASITDRELFGKRTKKPTIAKKATRRENLDFYLSPSDLQENDFVVHIRHGIGKFIKMQQMSIDKQLRDYLTIEYRNGDKLYVPVDQINLLTRYRGTGEQSPKLSKMGGADWDNVRRKTKKAVEEVAVDLLNLYAQRSKIIGFQFDIDTAWQQEMEEAFEFVETPDQLKAIQDVKIDMESDQPMDRLICGDVGYGKTEVAIRAIFKAVLSGKQVAILVPTTVLAQQHFNTIVNRFLPYPMNISMLSRFRTSKEQKETINRLVTGECDIVIGTHRLLQKDIEFKNLGLLVIDEEHRFGVKHKENLKKLRTQVDVISMSATPIPRTLYMAMSGIRDMSVINTAPVNRSPVKTYVGEFSNNIIRSAIIRELEREGQVYFVHNRVQSIYRAAYDLEQLVPEARVIVGHGQMKERELETIMHDFSNHKYDILLCTTIIESGLDIPNVNTMIIEDADRMGLAQLYQLRGRVGRSDRQAYAMCFYRPKKLLTREAKKRLNAIREFNTLGSGYQIALRDLEIRGIGNLLGTKQHGRMMDVGFDLYCEMLEEAVKKIKGQEVVKKYIPIIDINVTAFIPEEWIGDKEQKIVEYKRLAAVTSLRELQIISDEWEDRFGKIPSETINLITLAKIRLIASNIGINLVREEKDVVRIFTNYNFKIWKVYASKMPPKLVNRAKWIKNPETSVDGISTILVKYSGLTPKKLLNYLEELCVTINKINQENQKESEE